MFYKLKRLIKGKYFMNQIKLCDKSNAVDFDSEHEHICFAARILGNDIKNHCPHFNKKGFELEYGISDKFGGTTCECDKCKYFGVISSTTDGLKFYLDGDVVNEML